MAEKTFAVNDALANKLWSSKLSKAVEKKTYFGRFMGSSEENIIQVKSETGRSAGDKITCGLVMELVGDGVTENQILEGNEESMITYDDSIFVNELRHATKVRNTKSIDQQRVPFKLRDTARDRMAQWVATRMDTSFFLHLCGYTGASFSRDGQTIDPTLSVYNGNNTVVAPASSRVIRANSEADDESMNNATTHRFVLELIDEAVWKAKTAEPYIRPINIGGQEKYVMFLHPSQVLDLRTDATANTITWYQTQRARVEGGQGMDNPIFSGALGEYNGVILHEAFRIPNGVNSTSGAQVANTKRAVLCGAQAGMVAWGRETPKSQKYSWTEELFDYKHSLGVGIETIWGIKKSVFNSKDYGTIVVGSYGLDPS